MLLLLVKSCSLYSESDNSPILKGVGKSSSAEAAAAAAGRPFYAITAAEVGSTVAEVEKNLSRHFHLAETWGCVILIDEAEYVRMPQWTPLLLMTSLVYSSPVEQGLTSSEILWSQVC